MRFNPTRQDIRTYLVDSLDWERDSHEMIAGTEKLLHLSGDDGPISVRNLCDSNGFRRAQQTAPDYMVISEIWEIDDSRPEMKLSYEAAMPGAATVIHESEALKRWKRERVGIA